MTGEIKVKIPTSGKGGQTANEKFFVYTNIPDNKKITLKVIAKIESIVSIEPDRVHLWGNAGEKIQETIIITPKKNYEFKILDIVAANGRDIEYKIEKIKNNSFKLNITNEKTTKGTYSDILFLRTDSKLKPALRINIFGNIK
jgi:hypothetical protein